VRDGDAWEDGDATGAHRSRAGAYQWAELMRRTFGVDVLACPRCGGRLCLVALIDQAPVIQRILRHLGLPTDVPEPCPARPPPWPLDPIEVDGDGCRGQAEGVVAGKRAPPLWYCPAQCPSMCDAQATLPATPHRSYRVVASRNQCSL
jgi:hypothetical protein